VLEKYVSDDESDEDALPISLTTNDDDDDSQRTRDKNVAYTTIKSFATLEEARAFLKEEELWSWKSKSPSPEGLKYIYFCKHHKPSDKCKAKRCILVKPPPDEDDSLIEEQETDENDNPSVS